MTAQQVWEFLTAIDWREVQAQAGALVAAATAIVVALRTVLSVAEWLARQTPTLTDDEGVARAGRWLDRAAGGLAWAESRVGKVAGPLSVVKPRASAK